MKKFIKLCLALFMAVAAASFATPAAAQATRTWVSGVGDDLNPCSRTAPCKTFAGAISKTATNGEINCLDPGAFGAVTIGKAMSIVCQYTEAGALATLGSNDITINAPGTDSVFLSGLDLQGANTGLNGVRFIAGAALHIQHCIIRNFGAVNGQGVNFAPSGSSELYIDDTVITENGNGATGGGILVQPTGAGGTARVVLTNVRVNNNANNGMLVNTTGNTGPGITVVADSSSFSGNGTGISVVTPGGTTNATVMLTNSIVANNSGTGLVTNGGTSLMRVGNTTITGNAMGVNPAGGSTMATYGNNRNIGNPSVGAANNGAFIGVPLATQ